MQQYVRFDTVTVFFEGIFGGHTGALRESVNSKGYITNGQYAMHVNRQKAIETAKTPRDALLLALAAHINYTARRNDFTKLYHSGVDIKNRSFANKKDKEEMSDQYGIRVRDWSKRALECFVQGTDKDSDIKTPTTSPQTNRLAGPKPIAFQSVSDFAKVLPTFSKTLKSRKVEDT